MSHSRRWVCRWAARSSSTDCPSINFRWRSYAFCSGTQITSIPLPSSQWLCLCSISLVLPSRTKMTLPGIVFLWGGEPWSRWTPLSLPSRRSCSWTPRYRWFRRSSWYRWFPHTCHTLIWRYSWRCGWNPPPSGSVSTSSRCWFPPCSSGRWRWALSRKPRPPSTTYSYAHRRSRRRSSNRNSLTFLSRGWGGMGYQLLCCCVGRPHCRSFWIQGDIFGGAPSTFFIFWFWGVRRCTLPLPSPSPGCRGELSLDLTSLRVWCEFNRRLA